MHVTRSKKFFSEHTNGDDIHFSPPGASPCQMDGKGHILLEDIAFQRAVQDVCQRAAGFEKDLAVYHHPVC